MSVQRFDNAKLKANKTDEGYISDSPIVSRVGIFEYLNADGSTRRELRLPEEVFNEDSLKSLKGKPITKKHHGLIDSKNASLLSIGTVLSEGRRADGDLLQTDIIIHSPDNLEDWRELSLGYSTDLDETPGDWQGQKYDAIQRNIRYNHLSVVKRGRAGSIARLNLDGSEEIENDSEIKKMPTIRLDSGLEYEAVPEVAAAFGALRAENAKLKQDSDKSNAEKDAKIDTLQSRVDGFDAELKKAREDESTKIQNRAKLEAVAKDFKVDCAGKSDQQIKVAVIKVGDNRFDETDKNEHYIDARFDMAIAQREDAAAQAQRKSGVKTDAKDDDAKVVKSSGSRYDEHMASLSKKDKE